MLKTLTRIRSLPQSCKVNELSAFVRHISSYNRPRDEHLIQPRSVLSKEEGKYSILSNQLRPSLLMSIKARALLPKPLVLPRITGIHYYPWITTFEAHTTEIIGDDALNGDIIGYDTFELDTGTINCSSILKKRKHKMNKHKYKKRRKRDKFKRRNLENIKERKQKAREKAEERAKQAVG